MDIGKPPPAVVITQDKIHRGLIKSIKGLVKKLHKESLIVVPHVDDSSPPTHFGLETQILHDKSKLLRN